MLSMPKPAVGDPLCAYIGSRAGTPPKTENHVFGAPHAHLGFRPRPATPAPTRVGSLGFRFHTPIRAPRAHIGSRALARTRPEHLQKRKITCSAHRTRTLDFGPARRPRPQPGWVASESGCLRPSGRRGHTLTAVLSPEPGRNTSKNGKSRVRHAARAPWISAPPDDPGPYPGG